MLSRTHVHSHTLQHPFNTTFNRTTRQVHLYGPEVFEEACLDPIKTMKKDILPRFLTSSVFRRMVEDVAMWEPPPPASDLKVPPPGI